MYVLNNFFWHLLHNLLHWIAVLLMKVTLVWLVLITMRNHNVSPFWKCHVYEYWPIIPSVSKTDVGYSSKFDLESLSTCFEKRERTQVLLLISPFVENYRVTPDMFDFLSSSFDGTKNAHLQRRDMIPIYDKLSWETFLYEPTIFLFYIVVINALL